MRRPIQVFGCTLTDGTEIKAGENGIVSVMVHPDKSVTVTDSAMIVSVVDGEWVSYIPRFN